MKDLIREKDFLIDNILNCGIKLIFLISHFNFIKIFIMDILKLDIINEVTIRAIEEGRRMIDNSSGRRYFIMEDFKKAINKELEAIEDWIKFLYLLFIIMSRGIFNLVCVRNLYNIPKMWYYIY